MASACASTAPRRAISRGHGRRSRDFARYPGDVSPSAVDARRCSVGAAEVLLEPDVTGGRRAGCDASANGAEGRAPPAARTWSPAVNSALAVADDGRLFQRHQAGADHRLDRVQERVDLLLRVDDFD